MNKKIKWYGTAILSNIFLNLSSYESKQDVNLNKFGTHSFISFIQRTVVMQMGKKNLDLDGTWTNLIFTYEVHVLTIDLHVSLHINSFLKKIKFNYYIFFLKLGKLIFNRFD